MRCQLKTCGLSHFFEFIAGLEDHPLESHAAPLHLVGRRLHRVYPDDHLVEVGLAVEPIPEEFHQIGFAVLVYKFGECPENGQSGLFPTEQLTD